jgi:hypothetical protein
MNVQGRSYIIAHVPRPKRIKGRRTPPYLRFYLAAIKLLLLTDLRSTWIKGRTSQWAGHTGSKDGQISLISAINPHRSSHQTRATRNVKQDGQGESLARHSPSRGQSETHAVVHRADDSKVQPEHFSLDMLRSLLILLPLPSRTLR